MLLFIIAENQKARYYCGFQRNNVCVKFCESPSSGSRVSTSGQTDGREDYRYMWSFYARRANQKPKLHKLH
jgi:hypothetical protein